MNITVKGATTNQENYISSLVDFCTKKLMPRMQNLDITINVTKLDHAFGYCMAEDGERADRPREFTIDVARGLKLRDLLTTIAHEMVHVKQYARGELYQSARTAKMRWQGKWVGDMDYYDEPWEIEAHGREEGLFVRWCDATNNTKAWTFK